MATKRLSMRKIRSILKLKLKRGLTNRAAASAARASPGAVSSVMKRAKSKGLTSWEEVEPLEEAQLEALLYGGPTPGGQVRAEPDPVWMHTERQRKGVTLALLHLEYLEEHPDGLRYTAFCERYRKWTKAQRLSMRQVHRVGEKLFGCGSFSDRQLRHLIRILPRLQAVGLGQTVGRIGLHTRYEHRKARDHGSTGC
jgi:hypothetical protein